MYTLKSIAQRATTLGMAVGLLVTAIIPVAPVFADELNPLTERSLLLSSSAPGYINTDGSGNATFAGPGTGPNGQKTGETFSFKVSSDSTTRAIQGFTLQYCTGAAGNCKGPGNNTGDARDSLPTARETNAVAHPLGRSDLEVTDGATTWAQGTDAGEFQIYVNNVESTETWTMTTANREDTAHSGDLTGKHNFITLVSATGETPAAGTPIRIVFRASETAYITNPGTGAFFVKMNTYDSDDPLEHIPGGANNIDGGVTVANVMTDSIHITTKVLETMAFSVGVRNRDTVALNCGATYNLPTNDPVRIAAIADGCEAASGAVHGTCSPVQNVNNNRLSLGDPDAEFSLETGKAWDVNSYWRLSSNSSGGATVYYSGNTLANTVGDEISDMPNEAISTPGTEQFGLGFVDAGLDPVDADFQALVNGVDDDYNIARSFPFRTVSTQTTGLYDPLTLANQPVSEDYDEATGDLDDGIGGPGDAQFKFAKSSLDVPEAIAQQNDQVISCATAKMRYVGNIAADTPAGVYTTKINYLAAPQY